MATSYREKAVLSSGKMMKVPPLFCGDILNKSGFFQISRRAFWNAQTKAGASPLPAVFQASLDKRFSPRRQNLLLFASIMPLS